ncbi:glycosyltransferase family 4 protein [Candidatus Daviesbacteria bacterium]|nr:glycosyltransferase family 4 protein [Candidatus Daviesbacteria bacterium]
MLTPYLPYPLLTGGQTRSYNLIKRLSTLGHEITLFCLVKHNDERKYVSELEKFCKEVRVFNRPEKPWTIVNIFKTGFSLYPFLVIRNWAKGEKEAIEQKITKEDFDLIHAETFYVMPHIPKTTIPILLVEQTIEYLVYKHYVDKYRIWLLKLLLYIDVFKLKYWELKYWQEASRVVAMSGDDKEIMKKEVPSLKVDIVPNGVDSKWFGQKVTSKSQEPVILYLGNFTWLQNREAVSVLIKKIWPEILKAFPKANLWIIGKNAKNFFAELEQKNVRVDEVKDVREAYQKATILVAPIYSGGGTRLKNFETFASGLPVVTTSIGIGGTEAEDGKHVIIRDDPSDIAKAAIDLIQDKKLYETISQNAKNLVERKYDWKPIASKLSGIYEELGRKT